MFKRRYIFKWLLFLSIVMLAFKAVNSVGYFSTSMIMGGYVDVASTLLWQYQAVCGPVNLCFCWYLVY